ncbi:MAG: hypothetical protein N2Z79_02635 [Candidatus Omnitrophica bacterium]|nr:hypothetical protein [Candidatus Omnitrophota bacterium]
MQKRKIWERKTSLSKADRIFDIKFWQAQGSKIRFRVAFDMLKDYYLIKGKRINTSTFRLQRSIENIKPA